MKVRRVQGGGFAIWCPGCETAHVLDKRWTFNGNMERPTFEGSLLVRGYLSKRHPDGVCHSHIVDGEIRYVRDSTHELSGQTLPLEDF